MLVIFTLSRQMKKMLQKNKNHDKTLFYTAVFDRLPHFL
jgi:hypothetical protein